MFKTHMLHILNPQILQIFIFLKFSLGYFYSCITNPPTWVILLQIFYGFGLFKTYQVTTHIPGMYGTTNMQNKQIHSHYSYKVCEVLFAKFDLLQVKDYC
jgi:hypothetical protein